MYLLHTQRKHATRPAGQSASTQRRWAGFWRLAFAAPLVLLMAAALSLASIQPAKAAPASQPQLSSSAELTALSSLGTADSLLDAQDHFHLLYTVTTPHSSNPNLVDLLYSVVSSDQHPVVLVKPVTLAHALDALFSPNLLQDSNGRFHASWIERTSGVFTVRHALVEDQSAHLSASSIVPETLFQTNSFADALSGGADASGNVVYAWLDGDSGAQTVRAVTISNNQTLGKPFVLFQPSIEAAFPHLVVYPDGTLAVVMQQRNPKAGWDIVLTPFDATAHPLHDPVFVAQGVFPGNQNQKGVSNSTLRNDFRFDPLAVVLDATQKLHIAWGVVNKLNYAVAVVQSDHGFALQPTTLLGITDNYMQLCLSVGPNTLPGHAAATNTATTWIGWIDDSENIPMMPYVDQISNHETLAGNPTRLVPLTSSATNPCVQEDTRGNIYVTWLQYDDNNQYGFFMATTARPPEASFWTSVGLSAKSPIQQLIFIVLGSMLLGAFVTVADILAVPVIAGLVKLGQLVHTPRLVLLLAGLIPPLVLNIYIQKYLAANFNTPPPAILWPIVGCAVAAALMLYLWFRSRKIPMEFLGTVGRVFLASYIAAFILCLPIIYFSAPD
jgi:hypothetical protein